VLITTSAPAPILALQNLSSAFSLYVHSNSDGTPSPVPQAVTFLSNMLPSALVALEAREGGPEADASLSPAAAAARRTLCLSFLKEVSGSASQTLLALSAAVGILLNCIAQEAARKVGPGYDVSHWNAKDVSAALSLIHSTGTAEDGKVRVQDKVINNAFLGPLYRRRCCAVCGLLPDSADKLFQACSLCLDPSVGRFCCKEPCFAAFWKGGHKHECAGRDKLKKKKGSQGG
jgi:hypothetical protein